MDTNRSEAELPQAEMLSSDHINTTPAREAALAEPMGATTLPTKHSRPLLTSSTGSFASKLDRERMLAFLMASHPRLGAHSVWQKMPKPVVTKIYSFFQGYPVTKKLDEYFRQRDPCTWDELVFKIMDAADRRAKTLTLETKSLASIPSCIGECTKLEKLSLMGQDLVTLPPQIGNLPELTYLQTYCCMVLFYPFELLNCKRLHVSGQSLYIDLKSLLGRKGNMFPRMPSTIKSCAGESPQCSQTAIDGWDVKGADAAAMCSWCRAAWPSSAFTSWIQGQFPGGDRRDILPLLARFCSQACLDSARGKHNPSREALEKAKMSPCIHYQVALSRKNSFSKEAVCCDVLQIIQSNS